MKVYGTAMIFFKYLKVTGANMSKDEEEKIIDSWVINAFPWINAIREKQIESRQFFTNKAIIQAILKRSPKRILDVGCGEGWLSHELKDSCLKYVGFDAVETLVKEACKSSFGEFFVATYDDFQEKIQTMSFDTAVCNFSLFGNESVVKLFRNLKFVLSKNGFLIVQTLNPSQAAENFSYSDGWKQGSWDGFSKSFSKPAPWYFRTKESWSSLFEETGYDIIDMIEPTNPKTKKPASIIIVSQVRS